MRLNELFKDIPKTAVAGTLDHEIPGFSHDSRRISNGEIFFALPGSRTDGNLHIKEALSKGACAIVSEQMPPPAPFGIASTWIQVPDILAALAIAASEFYGHPSHGLQVVGITGTNGKTITSYFLESICRRAGKRPGVIGTINYRMDGKILSNAPNTTPVSPELQRLTAQMKKEGCQILIMEVSSHALALKRADEISFDAAVFTNLYRDHLDFHRDPDDYFAAKLRLFDLLGNGRHLKVPRFAIINGDDKRASQVFQRIQPPTRSLTCGFGSQGCDWRASFPRSAKENAALEGTEFDLHCPQGSHRVRLKIPGKYNVYNAMAAGAAAWAMGVQMECVLEGLESLESVPGRLEKVRANKGFHVFVDYAHTDSALEQVLENLRSLEHRRIITVFGCGGDRDHGKRAPMGVAACRFSDHAILTSDNPRGEDPMRILDDIEKGLTEAGLANYAVVCDRRQAIFKAIETAGEGDIVLIAGKGHEDCQIFADRTLHFDDREVAREAIKNK